MRSDEAPAPSLTQAARYHDYRYASNPLDDGTLGPIPAIEWPADLHEQGGTRIVPLDTSGALGCAGPATTPGLLANFIHVRPGDAILTDAIATSQLFFVMRGSGRSRLSGEGATLGGDTTGSIPWSAGDLFTLPAACRAMHVATDDAALYWVHDGPLLAYLGATASRPLFPPTLYPRGQIHAALDAVAHDPSSRQANRVSVLLGSQVFPSTLTLTHVLWAMFGLLPVGAVQAAHRHQSVAVDLVVDARPGCFTLVGESLDDSGEIVNPRRFDWRPHAVFLTPPGLWHSHHNESGHPAHILPIQDAGLHTHLRTLDIRFSRRRADGRGEVVAAAVG
jgi:gentisate 1,2-dioxygenase